MKLQNAHDTGKVHLAKKKIYAALVAIWKIRWDILLKKITSKEIHILTCLAFVLNRNHILNWVEQTRNTQKLTNVEFSGIVLHLKFEE